MISRLVAGLGDSALLLPASILLLVFLLWRGQARVALSLAAALALAGGATIGAKLAFHACGGALTGLDVVSPSGHASFTTIFYGALAILLGSGRPFGARWAAGAATALLVGAVGISRVRTGAHSPAEVAIGVGIGTAALALFAILHGRATAPPLPWLPVGIGFAAALLLLGGAHFSLEHRIGRLARSLSATLDVCSEPDRSGRRARFASP